MFKNIYELFLYLCDFGNATALCNNTTHILLYGLHSIYELADTEIYRFVISHNNIWYLTQAFRQHYDIYSSYPWVTKPTALMSLKLISLYAISWYIVMIMVKYWKMAIKNIRGKYVEMKRLEASWVLT